MAFPLRRNSITAKILFTGWFLIVVSISLTGFFSYRYSYRILKQQYVDSEEKQLSGIARQIDVLTQDVKRIAISESLDPRIQRFLVNPLPEDSYERYSSIERIRNTLSMLSVQRDYIATIAVLRNDEVLRSDSIIISNMKTDFGGDERSFLDALSEPWYTRIPDGEREFFSSRFSMELAHGEAQLIPYVLKVYDINNPNKRIGEIIIALRFEYLEEMLATPLEGIDQFSWLDPFGDVLYSPAREIPGTNPEQIRKYLGEARDGQLTSYQEDYGYVFADKTSPYGWTFISGVPSRAISERLRPIVYFFLVLTVAAMLLSMLILLPVTTTITRPISLLAEAMGRVSDGDLDATIDVHTNDEVNEVAGCFNTMLADIRDYIRTIGEHEALEKEMQQSLLLAQINPHFIYNTLQTIVYMAKKADAEDIVSMTNSFISVLQNIVRIGHGSVTTTLSLELEGIRHYMTIQDFRYQGRFNLSINVDGDLLGLEVPRSIIQPLVENALYHGILSSTQVGQIEIAGRIANGDLVITVMDDGKGIPPEELEGLLGKKEKPVNPGTLPSIGLTNLNDRIRFLYGEGYGLVIHSEYGSYTSVAITLPVRRFTGN